MRGGVGACGGVEGPGETVAVAEEEDCGDGHCGGFKLELLVLGVMYGYCVILAGGMCWVVNCCVVVEQKVMIQER